MRSGLGVEIQQQMTPMEIGQAEIVESFNDAQDDVISILAFGSRVQAAVEAAQKLAEQDLAVRVVNMRFGSASREEDQRRTLQRGSLCRSETEIRMTRQLKKW